jgi:hypothetical protein
MISLVSKDNIHYGQFFFYILFVKSDKRGTEVSGVRTEEVRYFCKVVLD